MRKLPFFILLFFLVVSFLLQAYYLPPSSQQEARRALIAIESADHPLFPTLNGEPYLTKPPLHPLLSAPILRLIKLLNLNLEAKLFGLRLLSLLSYGAEALIIYFILERNLQQTMLTLFILFSSFRFLAFALRIDLEPPFVFFSNLALLFFFWYEREKKARFLYLFYLFSGVASLVRGPLNLLLVLGIYLYGFLKVRKNLSTFLKPTGLVLFLGPQLLWFAFSYLKFGEVSLQGFLSDLQSRALPGHDPFYYYPLSAFLNFFPYFVLLLLKLRKGWVVLNLREVSVPLFLIVPTLFILSLSGKKYDKYLLFIYPFLAIFLAKVLIKLYRPRFIFFFSLSLFILNFCVNALLNYQQIKGLKPKVEAIKQVLPCEKRLCFQSEPSYLFILLCERSIPKCSDLKVERASLLLVTTNSCQGLKLQRQLKDPYKDKEWHLCQGEDLSSKD